MSERPAIPTIAIAVAIVTALAMAIAGTSLWIVLAVLLVWVVSFWLVPAPVAPPARAEREGVQLTPEALGELLEHSGLPIFMLDGERIVVANGAAREAIGGHTLGQDARVAFRHPEAVELLARPAGGSATIHGLTGPGSSWQMTRQPIDQRYALVELVNRTAEVDVSRAHTDFVANASHELRTPLASIIGYVETLVEEGRAIDQARAHKFLTTVLREARRLQELVADLLSLSRVEAEKHDQPRERVALVPLIKRAARDGAGLERFERVDFIVEADREPVVRGDINQLEQLVRNLVDNALKYGDHDAPVTVQVEEAPAGMATLRVQDRGEGIAAEHLPHLTRRFYRTDPGRSRAEGGTGLGLAIVKHIVERHRGRLDFASRKGEGTTVTVRLPLAD